MAVKQNKKPTARIKTSAKTGILRTVKITKIIKKIGKIRKTGITKISVITVKITRILKITEMTVKAEITVIANSTARISKKMMLLSA